MNIWTSFNIVWYSDDKIHVFVLLIILLLLESEDSSHPIPDHPAHTWERPFYAVKWLRVIYMGMGSQQGN